MSDNRFSPAYTINPDAPRQWILTQCKGRLGWFNIEDKRYAHAYYANGVFHCDGNVTTYNEIEVHQPCTFQRTDDEGRAFNGIITGVHVSKHENAPYFTINLVIEYMDDNQLWVDLIEDHQLVSIESE